ncbi:MAG: glycosyltransferase [Phycisphaerales bacterium]|nr:glycosyltransferase [Phycisphaerales bacterium]
MCVALPVFNAETSIDVTLKKVLEFARQHPTWEFVFVDDGSRDRTGQILRGRVLSLEVGDPEVAGRVRVISLRANRGKGFVIRHAALASTAECFLFTDGDLAYSLDQLDTLREALRTAEVAVGCRAQPSGDFAAEPARRIMGIVFNRLARLVTGLSLPDTQAGLKGFRGPAAREIFSRCRIADFAFDVEVLYLARRLGCSITRVTARVSGTHAASGTSVRIIRDPWVMLRSLVSIRTFSAMGRYQLAARAATTSDRGAQNA